MLNIARGSQLKSIVHVRPFDHGSALARVYGVRSQTYSSQSVPLTKTLRLAYSSIASLKRGSMTRTRLVAICRKLDDYNEELRYFQQHASGFSMYAKLAIEDAREALEKANAALADCLGIYADGDSIFN